MNEYEEYQPAAFFGYLLLLTNGLEGLLSIYCIRCVSTPVSPYICCPQVACKRLAFIDLFHPRRRLFCCSGNSDSSIARDGRTDERTNQQTDDTALSERREQVKKLFLTGSKQQRQHTAKRRVRRCLTCFYLQTSSPDVAVVVVAAAARIAVTTTTTMVTDGDREAII